MNFFQKARIFHETFLREYDILPGNIKASGRKHSTVCHSAKEFARDDEGDGINEVHYNSCEGLCTGGRNFLRLFRGIHKRFLAQYIAIFENAFNFRNQTHDVIRAMIIPDFYLHPNLGMSE